MFGDVGRSLGPLLIGIFTSTIQAYFMLLLFIRFAITHAAILFSYGRVKYYALTDYLHVEAHWFRLHRIWIRFYRIFV